MSFSLNEEQRAALQPEVQRELEKREWAEAGDNVMAEYVTVLLANGNSRERVHTEMDDYFHPEFLDWLFDSAQRLIAPPRERERDISPVRERENRDRSPVRSRRLLDTALGGLGNNKRKSDADGGSNKRRISEGLPTAPAAAPGGPRAMMGEGRGLADRMGPRRGGIAVRGMGRGGMGGGGGFGFRGNGMPNQNMNMNMNMNQSQGFGSFFNPGQQEMMAQMMMMQANMAQMGEMMQHMVEEKEQTAPPAPTRSAPVKVPHGTKLGGHSVSAITPKPSSAPGPIPEKPSSKALCRYSIGCSNARCPYSHPSPVADEQSGMVLSEEPCEEGKKCKDAECTKSHVSPAAVLGDTAGPSRLLCKYLNCTNPACAFRHEDAQGNPIPPPALTAAKIAKETPAPKSPAVPTGSSVNAGSDNEDGDFEVVMSSRGLMDGPLDDKMGAEKQCRYGERCTRPDCKFNHPASRPTPKAKFGAGKAPYKAPSFGNMNKSKKFGSAASSTGGEKKTLNPSAGSFVPKEVAS